MELIVGADNPVTVIIPPGVVHGYRNISAAERGMVLNFPNRLYRGWGRQEEVDEIRHEDDIDSPFVL
jgi:dTDP-4-dehydrorhamnose 3,5-epimerase